VAYFSSSRNMSAFGTRTGRKAHSGPGPAVQYYNKGVQNYSSGQYREALEAFQQAIRFKLDWAEAHSNLGAAYNDSGLYLEAVKSLNQAVRLKPSLAETHRNLGKTNGKECKNLDFSLVPATFEKGKYLRFCR
jgi:tetratricopeptide (TPR) repeat protein